MENTRKARIVCTLGPATSSEKDIEELIKSGMNVARLNFSHGDHGSHGETIERIRRAAAKLGKEVAILQDLQGIKIRVGKLQGGQVDLVKGAELSILAGDGTGATEGIYIPYPNLIDDAKVGDTILLDDGLIQLKAVKKEKEKLVTTVVEGGLLKEEKGVNLPGMKLRGTSFTDKDREDLEFGLTMGVEYVALSFVRTVEDVLAAKSWLAAQGATVSLIAKIEKEEAIQDIDRILREVDGIMVARGDLGVEIPLEQVPIYQKMLIKKAGQTRRLVITATQMLESMTVHERPTRAETTDVANAVMDGTDAVMLSEETASGKHPILAVRMMDRIVSYTEASWGPAGEPHGPEVEAEGLYDIPEAVAHAASHAASEVGGKAIVAFTTTGFTARLLSKFRPSVPVIAFSPDEGVVRKMALYWGVFPHKIEKPEDTDRLVETLDRMLIDLGYAASGDKIVIVAGLPVLVGGKTNFMKIHTVGDL